MWSIVLLITLVLALPIAIGIARSNELFVLALRAGRLRLVRGRLPGELLHELSDVLERGRVGQAQLRVVVEGGKARLKVTGKVSEATEQQLRNVVGRFAVATIRAGSRRAR